MKLIMTMQLLLQAIVASVAQVQAFILDTVAYYLILQYIYCKKNNQQVGWGILTQRLMLTNNL